MNAVIYLDVPDWQIGQDVTVYFPDTMVKRCKCELLKEQDDIGKELTDAMELIHKKNERIKKLEEQIETLTRWRANAGAFD